MSLASVPSSSGSFVKSIFSRVSATAISSGDGSFGPLFVVSTCYMIFLVRTSSSCKSFSSIIIGSGVFIYCFLSTIFVKVSFSVLKGSSSFCAFQMPSIHNKYMIRSVTVTNTTKLTLLTFSLLLLMRFFDILCLFNSFDVHDWLFVDNEVIKSTTSINTISFLEFFGVC